MAGDARSPTLRRRELGALLRAMRTEAGMTVEQVAEALLVSPSKVSRLETGHRGASQRDIRDLCNLYGITDATQRDHLTTLGKEGQEQAWWQPYDLPYATYVGLEAEAASIRDFAGGVFHGLLQIPDYTRAVHEGGMPQLMPAVIEQRVEVLGGRQAILRREDPPPPQLWAIVDEAVLHRPVGGPAVMAAQLGHVIEVCDSPDVTIQVIAYEAGAHPALDSKFTLLEFAGPAPGMVYVEGLVGQLHLERSRDVQRYQEVFERLTAMALSEQRSVELMAKMRAGFTHY
jgi:transcriptional regulator with XRE-family HTH domain